MKAIVRLEKEMETLLIPLYGRANMSKKGLFTDTYAEQLIKKIDYDFSKLNVASKIQIFMSIRGGLFDDYANGFLYDNKEACVISLGSGLDARYMRVKGYAKWIDLDFPEVIALRKQLLPAAPDHQNIGSSVVKWDWMDEVKDTKSPVLIIAEGLLMYLDGQDIKKLFEKLLAKFPKAVFVFDAHSLKTVNMSKYQPSLKKTGAMIRWGIDEPGEISKLVPGICYDRTFYLTDKRYIEKLNVIYRSMFYIADKFKMAKESHRIFVFHALNK